MTAHTKGPWEAVDLDGKPVNDPAIMSAKNCIATCWINDIPRKQAAANARLMAAAPDLLAAILNSDDAHWTPAMRAAIAKATGGAS